MAILDADKEVLRSGTSLIQTIGRAARNVSGEVHMYADKITDSMRYAIDETERRRAKQVAYNEARGIDPQPLRKKIADILDQVYREADDTPRYRSAGRAATRRGASARRVELGGRPPAPASSLVDTANMPRAELADLVQQLSEQMLAAARTCSSSSRLGCATR